MFKLLVTFQNRVLKKNYDNVLGVTKIFIENFMPSARQMFYYNAILFEYNHLRNTCEHNKEIDLNKKVYLFVI